VRTRVICNLPSSIDFYKTIGNEVKCANQTAFRSIDCRKYRRKFGTKSGELSELENAGYHAPLGGPLRGLHMSNPILFFAT
jgi:hypothetical protein